MDTARASSLTCQREASSEQADGRAQPKRRRISHSPAAEAGQVRVKKEPKERWVEIEAAYEDESPPMRRDNGTAASQEERMDESESGSAQSSGGHVAQHESDATASERARGSVGRLSSATSVDAIVKDASNTHLPDFPLSRKPWPGECEVALIRFVAREKSLREWAIDGTCSGHGHGELLQGFIDLHGLPRSTSSLVKKLSDWRSKYDMLRRRLTTIGCSTLTSTWEAEDLALIRDYCTVKKDACIRAWHDELYVEPSSNSAAPPPPAASSKRQSRRVTGREGSSATASRSGAAIDSGVPSGIPPERAREERDPPAPKKKKTMARRDPNASLLPKPVHRSDTQTLLERMQSQLQQQTAQNSQQKEQLARQNKQLQLQSQQLERLTTQVERHSASNERQANALDRHADAFERVNQQLASLHALIERQRS